jgi:hypothetical protein
LKIPLREQDGNTGNSKIPPVTLLRVDSNLIQDKQKAILLPDICAYLEKPKLCVFRGYDT